MSNEKHLRIGIDIDGCIADFDRPFGALLADLSGKPCPYEEPTCWEWPAARGFTPEEEAAAWNYIKERPWWWLHLPKFADAHFLFRDYVRAGHEFYFITARHHAKQYAEQWLCNNTDLAFPTVLLSKEKGLAALALRLDAFIDDKPEHAIQVKVTSPKTRTYLRQRLHNQPMQAYLEKSLQIIPVASLRSMLDTEFAHLTTGGRAAATVSG